MELNKIYNMDCLEGMKQIPDKSIDMILCDPPYGTTNCRWDSVLDLPAMWKQYERIIKDNGAILIFAQAPYDKVLACSNIKLFRYEWIWEKTSATGHYNAKRMPMKAHENILVFYKKMPTYNPQMTQGHKPVNSYHKPVELQNRCSIYKKATKTISGGGSTERYPRDVLLFPSDKQKSNLHPTQKPVELCKYLIKTYTKENNIVLDNCVGSGTTAIAALETGRRFIGYELEEGYFKTAKQRILDYMLAYTE